MAMTQITVTKAESGAIHLTKNGANYKGYQNH